MMSFILFAWGGAYSLWMAIGLHESSKFRSSIEEHWEWLKRCQDWACHWQLTVANWFNDSFEFGKRLNLSRLIESSALAKRPGAPARDRPGARALALLSPLERELNSLREARHRPFAQIDFRTGGSVYKWRSRANPRTMRSLAELFCLRAAAQLELDRSGEALEDVLVLQKLADLAGSLPSLEASSSRVFLFDYAVQCLWEGLTARRWSDLDLRTIQAAFQPVNLIGDFDRHLRADHALSNFTLEPLGLGLALSLPWVPPSLFENQLLFRKLFAEQCLNVYSVEQRLVFPDRSRSADASLRDVPRRGISIALNLVPRMEKLAKGVARSQSFIHLVLVACALERYYLANNSYPASLDELTTAYAAQVPKDVIGGQPLQYRPRENGSFQLYAVGWNGADDGGAAGKADEDAQGDWGWFASPQERN